MTTIIYRISSFHLLHIHWTNFWMIKNYCDFHIINLNLPNGNEGIVDCSWGARAGSVCKKIIIIFFLIDITLN